jgi:hypothetical protein
MEGKITVRFRPGAIESKSLKEWSDEMGDGEIQFEDYEEVAFAVALEWLESGDYYEYVLGVQQG